MDISQTIISTLKGFKIAAEVVEVQSGAAVDRYVLRLAPGVRVGAMLRLEDDLAMATAASSVRVLAPIPGTKYVGVEVPAMERATIPLERVSAGMVADHPLRFPVGMAVDGTAVTARLDELPHAIVAGATGSGKSVFITGMLAHLVANATPEEVMLLLIDPKRVELAAFAGLPHLGRPVATDIMAATDVLRDAVAEMDKRWGELEEAGKKNIADLDDAPPYVVLVVDELADLMMTGGKSVEDLIVRLLQLGRAAGIHLILGTQRPSTDVITGLIKTNTPSRMAFAMTSHTDSNVAMGQSGAEKLLGRGDGLWWPAGASQPERVQGVFLSDEELEETLEPIKMDMGSPATLVEEELEEETPEERDARVREGMLTGLRARRVLSDEYGAAPSAVTAPSVEEEPAPMVPPVEELPAEEVELGEGSAMAVRRATESEVTEAFGLGYEKGRMHAEIELDLPTHRPAWSGDWKVAIPLALLAMLVSVPMIFVLPVLAGVWVGWIVIRRRTSMVTFRKSLAPRRTGEHN